jgi:hypothetical protein
MEKDLYLQSTLKTEKIGTAYQEYKNNGLCQRDSKKTKI